MSEKGKRWLLLVLAFLAGFVLAAIVAFTLIRQQDIPALQAASIPQEAETAHSVVESNESAESAVDAEAVESID